LDITIRAQTLAESIELLLVWTGVSQEANAGDLADLLRARRERPCRCCTAEQRHELAPVTHSITSSATESSDGGTVRPSIRAVTALMTSSNLLARLGALEDAAGVDANLTKRIVNVDSVAHQPADFGSFTQRVGRRDFVERRQVDQLDTPTGEKSVIANEQGVGPLAHESCEGRFDLRTGAGFENLDLQSHAASSL